MVSFSPVRFGVQLTFRMRGITLETSPICYLYSHSVSQRILSCVKLLFHILTLPPPPHPIARLAHTRGRLLKLKNKD